MLGLEGDKVDFMDIWKTSHPDDISRVEETDQECNPTFGEI